MYMQIRKYRVISGDAEQVCKQAAEEFLPIVKRIPGFVDYLIVDNDDGNVMSINVFQDKNGTDESNSKAQEWHSANASRQLEGPQEVIEGEVRVDASGFLKRAPKAA